jgi:hypothetical protein
MLLCILLINDDFGRLNNVMCVASVKVRRSRRREREEEEEEEEKGKKKRKKDYLIDLFC